MLHLIIRTLKLRRLGFTCERMPQPQPPNSHGVANLSFICTHSSSGFRLTNPLFCAHRNFLLLCRLVLPETPAPSRFLRPSELLRPPTCATFWSLGSFRCGYPGDRRQSRGQITPIPRGQRCAPAPAGDLTLPDVPQTMTLTRQTALRAARISGKCRTIHLIFILIKLNNVLIEFFSN